ncbi:MAG: CPBP family intramembrane metalloprotease [Lachnospiraceae bacterium]|nr:CPBP family intramembrane metalloprotease [Lachnospiraceae bacterium]
MINKTYKEISSFLLIAFLLPLISIILQSIITDTLIKFVLYGIEAASPSIAATIIIMINKRCKDFFKNMFHLRHLVMAIFLPVIISCSTMLLAKLIFCFWFRTDFMLYSISFTQLIVILWAFIAEEIGWRGYLEPLLEKKIFVKSIVPFIVGTVWCLWHYHYFLMNGIQVPILLFSIGCIIESYIYSFLMGCTNNNLISAMTYHFSWNLAVHIFAINPVDNNGNTFPYLILTILEAFVLLIFLCHKKRPNFD